jgi:voltage-gated potassium channel
MSESESKPRSYLRNQLHIIIEGTDTPAGKGFDVLLLISIVLSVVVVMLDSVLSLRMAYGQFFALLEWIFTIFFTIEYGLRIYSSPNPRRYMRSFFGVVDLLSILPTYLSLLFGGVQYLLVVRVIRIMRIFRVLKLIPYLQQAGFLLNALRGSQQKIVVFFVSIMTLVTIFGSILYVVEGPEHGFSSIPTSIYWAIVTLTTVGYGDISPKTPFGQAIASLVMITGYAIIAVPTGIFTAELARNMRSEIKAITCSRCGKFGHAVDAEYCDRCGQNLLD